MDTRPHQSLEPNFRDSLATNRIDPTRLSIFQRILLTTDGTVTEMLEAYMSENIQIVKLSENNVEADCDIADLEIQAGQQIIERKILLQGKISRNNWIYAESVLVPERLNSSFRERLTQSKEPIGRIWIECRMEIFKEIVASYLEISGDLSQYFDINKEDKLLCRTYVVFSERRPLMMITEKFPEKYFI